MSEENCRIFIPGGMLKPLPLETLLLSVGFKRWETYLTFILLWNFFYKYQWLIFPTQHRAHKMLNAKNIKFEVKFTFIVIESSN